MSGDALTVRVRGLEAFGHHGVLDAERELGQSFVVDLDIDLRDERSSHSDELIDTVDYASLADAVCALVSGPPVALLERLAGMIADLVLEDPRARAVTVTVHKPHVALRPAVAETAVTLRRDRVRRSYWLGLGANLGDRRAALEAALVWLDAAGHRVEAVSPAYETAPREVADQPAFLNAAARVASDLDPAALLAEVKRMERELGRDPGGARFGPRAIDCDLLLWEGGAWSDPDLEVPHPRLSERRFALLPLLDLDPDLTLPDGRLLADLAAAIDPADQPAERVDPPLATPPGRRGA